MVIETFQFSEQLLKEFNPKLTFRKPFWRSNTFQNALNVKVLSK